jgi:hypothetical protein
MPIIAYQSFNANSSNDHSLAATSFQFHTLKANKTALKSRQYVLTHPVLPLGDANMVDAVEGPPNRERVQKLVPPEEEPKGGRKRRRDPDDEEEAKAEAARAKRRKVMQDTRLVQGTHLAAIFQRVQRLMSAMPDLLVVGELDVSHKDYSGQLVTDPRVLVTAHRNDMACQSFSSFSNTAGSSQAKLLHAGVGSVVFSVANTTIAFVHVPNAIAGDKEETRLFYEQIRQDLLKETKACIHMIVGDTNQPGFGHTVASLAGMATPESCSYDIAHGNRATLSDTHVYGPGGANQHMVVKGTNSVGTKMFDVAVFCKACVRIDDVQHFSQSGTGTTVTDHAGLVVKFTRL